MNRRPIPLLIDWKDLITPPLFATSQIFPYRMLGIALRDIDSPSVNRVLCNRPFVQSQFYCVVVCLNGV